MTATDENAANLRVAPPEPGRSVVGGAGTSLRELPARLLHSPWTYVVAGLPVLAFVLIRVAGTSPGFDPYGWLIWGYQTLRLNLNLGGAPSWKPVTFLFTVPYSVFGHYSYWLWMVTAVAFALAGPIVAGRIVFRLVRESTEETWPAVAGALFAAVALLGIYQYTHYWLSAQSDPMLATLFLLAIDMHLSEHPRWALTSLLLCSLGRPESWPFMGLYAIWAWRAVPAMRKLIVVELVLVPAFWFGVPVLSGNNWDVAGQLAQKSPRELHSNKIGGTLQRYLDLSYWPVEVPALLGLAWAAYRRNWRVVGVAGCVVLWLIIEVAFALHGFPGVPRYMFEAAAATSVVAGVAFGWVLGEPRRIAPAARLGGVAAAVVVIGFLVPYLSDQVSMESTDITAQQARTEEISLLHALIDRAGGAAHVRGCGDPTVDVEYVSILAWYMHMNVGKVGHQPLKMIRKPTPVVLFTALGNGWIMHTYHLRTAGLGNCRLLNQAYLVRTKQHPNGVFGHQV